MWLSSGLTSKMSLCAYELWANRISSEEPWPPPKRRGKERNQSVKFPSRSCRGLDGSTMEVWMLALRWQWFLSPCPCSIPLHHPPPYPSSWSGSRAWPGWHKRCEWPDWPRTDWGVRFPPSGYLLQSCPPTPPRGCWIPSHCSCRRDYHWGLLAT